MSRIGSSSTYSSYTYSSNHSNWLASRLNNHSSLASYSTPYNNNNSSNNPVVSSGSSANSTSVVSIPSNTSKNLTTNNNTNNLKNNLGVLIGRQMQILSLSQVIS